MDPREKDFISPEEVDGLVWSKLLEWLNGAGQLNPDIREAFVERLPELRLRMQAIFIEIQRKFLSQVAAEAEFEEHLRRDIRENIPYMTAKEKLEALKTLQATTEDRMKRLEAQLAGFDFFNTVQVSVQSMSDTKVAKSMTTAVTAMPPVRRQQLLAMLNDIVANVGTTPADPLGPADVVIDTTPIPPDAE
jgi:hypothetical protein